jgi:pimeloyl-ACP methyl ester carboxylesterase
MNSLAIEQKWLEGANGKICYFLNKNFENRPTAVFLHGLSANHTTWDNLVQELNRFQLNILLLDLRGHGHSDKSKKRNLYKIPVFTEDLKEIIEKENLSQIILFGYSFGGFIALDYTIKYPKSVATLILISANHTNPLRYMHLNLLTWPAYGAANLLAWLLIWQKRKKYYYFNQATDLGYWRSTLKGYLTMPLSINLWMLSENAHIDFSQDLGKIACPTLIIKSRSDHLVSQAETADMARKIKFSKSVVMDETSHYLASRHQTMISGVIIDFLREKNII